MSDAGRRPSVDLKTNSRVALEVRLQKSAVIVGRVVDETGEPVVNARLVVLRRRSATEQSAPRVQGGQTNDLGEFRLFGLSGGEYYVSAIPPVRPDVASSASERSTTMLPTYYPATTDFAAAEWITLASGETSREITIALVSVSAYQVSGIVTDGAGHPIAEALVRLEPQSAPGLSPMPMVGPRSGQIRTDSSGTFTITNVIDGRYTLLAIAPVVIRESSSTGQWDASVTGMSSGMIGGGVSTYSSNGRTIRYVDSDGARLPVVVSGSSLNGLEIVVPIP
jgi:hypothetical protein